MFSYFNKHVTTFAICKILPPEHAREVDNTSGFKASFIRNMVEVDLVDCNTL